LFIENLSLEQLGTGLSFLFSYPLNSPDQVRALFSVLQVSSSDFDGGKRHRSRKPL
jgi:hypothetical protein